MSYAHVALLNFPTVEPVYENICYFFVNWNDLQS